MLLADQILAVADAWLAPLPRRDPARSCIRATRRSQPDSSTRRGKGRSAGAGRNHRRTRAWTRRGYGSLRAASLVVAHELLMVRSVPRAQLLLALPERFRATASGSRTIRAVGMPGLADSAHPLAAAFGCHERASRVLPPIRTTIFIKNPTGMGLGGEVLDQSLRRRRVETHCVHDSEESVHPAYRCRG